MLPGTQQIGNWSALSWTEWLPHRLHSKEVYSSPLNGATLTPGLVQTLAADWMSGYQATVLKTSSNTTIPEAWITDPATESWLLTPDYEPTNFFSEIKCPLFFILTHFEQNAIFLKIWALKNTFHAFYLCWYCIASWDYAFRMEFGM